MDELMYHIDSGPIAAVLFVAMAVAIETGFRVGVRVNESATEALEQQFNAIQSSILGILALLLAFTFSLSLQRFDTRSEAVVDEANAIGTAYLRAQLIPLPLRQDARTRLHDYLDLRIQASSLSMVEQEELGPMLAKVAAAQAGLWDLARQSAELEPNPVTSGLFIQSVNELIDSCGRRDAAVSRHVPEVVLFLLYGTLLITALIIGMTCGVSGQRPSLVTFAIVLVIAVLVFVILDLDRPRRGLIEVDQKSLLDLQAFISAESGGLDRQSPATGVRR